MAETYQTNATRSPWLLGMLFAGLLPLAAIVIGALVGALSSMLASALVLAAFAAILLAAGAVAARQGANGALVGAIAAALAAAILLVLQLFRVAMIYWGARFLEDASVATNRFVNTVYALLLVVIAAAIGALLGWIGGKLAGRRAA